MDTLHRSKAVLEVEEWSLFAERVGELLEAAYVQQQSGLLSIEYIQGNYVEKGELYVLVGRPVYASTGSLVGEEALGYLLTWRDISASFVSDASEPLAHFPAGETAYPVSGSMSDLPTLFPPLPAPMEVGQLIGTERLVPRRIKLEQDTTMWPLTYSQRWIYFMVDGQRTIGDLAQCSGKTITETKWILRELQDQCLIVVKSSI